MEPDLNFKRTTLAVLCKKLKGAGDAGEGGTRLKAQLPIRKLLQKSR